MLTEDHPNRLSFKHELARAYLCNAQVEEAIQLLEHIVGVEKISLAEDHPDRGIDHLGVHAIAREDYLRRLPDLLAVPAPPGLARRTAT